VWRMLRWERQSIRQVSHLTQFLTPLDLPICVFIIDIHFYIAFCESRCWETSSDQTMTNTVLWYRVFIQYSMKKSNINLIFKK